MITDELTKEKIQLRDAGSVPLLTKGNINHLFPKEKALVLFFDYDGTLSPIVNQPEDAIISDEMKEALKKCAAKFKISVVSGRDLDDVKSRVGIDDLIYAGSHGFRISGPDGLHMEYQESEKVLPLLDQVEDKLQNEFSKGPKGVRVERKRYAIAVHYRNADENALDEIKNKIKYVLKGYSDIKTGSGKKIIEVKPDLNWHKGKAVKWILDSLNFRNEPEVLPVYIGDDVTDEDAFRTLYDNGLGILVGTHGQPTAARYRLNDVDEVRIFLENLYKIR